MSVYWCRELQSSSKLRGVLKVQGQAEIPLPLQAAALQRPAIACEKNSSAPVPTTSVGSLRGLFAKTLNDQSRFTEFNNRFYTIVASAFQM
jgi:hypothetical protein